VPPHGLGGPVGEHEEKQTKGGHWQKVAAHRDNMESTPVPPPAGLPGRAPGMPALAPKPSTV